MTEKMSEKVSVRWWNHRNAIHKAVRSLQHQEMFADIILVCQGKKVEAHKFVLSACSEYFSKELQEMPFRGLFYLPAEISEKHLPSLLDYIYGGEAIVDEKDVNDLMKAAETLSIRGLAIPFSDQEEEDEESEEELHKSNVKRLMSKQIGNAVKMVKSDAHSKGLENNENKLQNEITGENSVTGCELRYSNKPPSHLDVTRMLSVVINGDQTNSRIGVHSERLHDLKEERSSDPNLKCPHCQRQFHWRSNLTKHIRIHTGEKPYTCPNCDYKTGYSEALKRHIRTHTGERPYECSLCDYKCKDNSSLKLHMNKHTGASSFPCLLCPYKTRIRSAFEKHMLAYHENQELEHDIKVEDELLQSSIEECVLHGSDVLEDENKDDLLQHNIQSELHNSNQTDNHLQHGIGCELPNLNYDDIQL